VFVVESRLRADGTPVDRARHVDAMRPLLIHDDHDEEEDFPAVPLPPPPRTRPGDTTSAATAVDEVPVPATLAAADRPPFLAAETAPVDDVFPPAEQPRLRADQLPTHDELPGAGAVGAEAAQIARADGRTVELSAGAVLEFYTSWFDQPWVAYLVVVVASSLMAAAADADPAALILVVLISTALCLLLCPPRHSVS